jgi:SAM-dependent methyltransferase
LRRTWTGTGVDISEAAIAYATRLAEHKGVADRVRFQTGSLTEIPYQSNSLDLVIASEVIEHLPEPGRALRELSRVLTPAGILLITMPVASHSPAHMQALNNAGELNDLCEAAGLRIASIKCRWHFGFGDDRRHIFATAQARPTGESRTNLPYSLVLPQTSSAASSGMVSS